MFEALKNREALSRLQEDLPQRNEKIDRWLDRHKDAVLALISERNHVITGELLGINRKILHQWYIKSASSTPLNSKRKEVDHAINLLECIPSGRFICRKGPDHGSSVYFLEIGGNLHSIS